MITNALYLNAQKTIYARKDVPVRVRDSAWMLFLHELEKATDEQSLLEAVLAWLDEQRKMEARRRMEPSTMERKMLAMLACDGLTMKEIAGRTGRALNTTKHRFLRMRRRYGNLTMYQLVALSVERGWVTISKE